MTNVNNLFMKVFIILTLLCSSSGKKHTLKLYNEDRDMIDITTFGFFQNGMLAVDIQLTFNKSMVNTFIAQDGVDGLVDSIGFTLDKLGSDGSASYMEGANDVPCVLDTIRDDISVVFLKFNFRESRVLIDGRGNSKVLQIYPMPQLYNISVVDDDPNPEKDSERKKTDEEVAKILKHLKLESQEPPRYGFLQLLNSSDDQLITFAVSFVVCITDEKEAGLYNLYFHHCQSNVPRVNLTVGIVEMNGENYLSAGDIPLPSVFITMSVIFFGSAVFWFMHLRKKKDDVFKIHYLMLLLIFLKALSLMFHSLDYYFIGKDGSPMEALAILFYITNLTTETVLFIVIVLVGSGWEFIKPILSDKDKKLLIVVILLQVLANVAYIITDTSEEGESQYITWKAVFVLVDILCCGATLFPVIWSIHHLKAATTDGVAYRRFLSRLRYFICFICLTIFPPTTDEKVAKSLVKLKLYRHFYVLVVCYIYFTRIIVYLLKETVPFQYMWLDELVYEIATYLFFAATAFKFRPGSDSPYLLVPEEDEEDIEVEIGTKSGLTDGVVRLSSTNSTT